MPTSKSLIISLVTGLAIKSPLSNGAVLEKRPFVFLNGFNDVFGLDRPGATSPPYVNSIQVMPEEATAATLEPAAAPATSTLLTMPVTSTPPSQITPPPPSRSAGCVLWPQCNLFYHYVNVHYWPVDAQNTACLSAHSNTTSLPPNIPNIQSPSVYVVFPSIHGYDGCNFVGKTFIDLTTSFASGALSTIGLDSSTYSFNFGDLPCPPADVGWDPSRGPYAPLLAPPDFLFRLDPLFATCIAALHQGIDPYTTLTTALADSGPGGVGCRREYCNRIKRALEHAHPLSWAPRKTAEPTS